MSLRKLIKSKFGYDVSDLSAYVDEQREELLTRQVSEARTLSLINIQTGIKHSEALKLMDDTITYQAGDCSMTPSGDTVFSDRVITVETLGFMKEFCNKDLAGFWTQLSLRPGASAEDKELPFQAQLLNYILSLHAKELDSLIWKGNKSLPSGNLSFMDGFIKLLTTANGCVDLNQTAISTLTSSNAYNVFFGAYQEMQASNATLAEDETAGFFCGVETLTKLRRNMIDLNFFTFTPDANNYSQPLFGTTKMVEAVNGLNGTNKIYFGKRSEMVFGTDLESDFDNIELWYSQDDDKLKLRSKFRAGVQVPFLDQIGVFDVVTSES
jgi:hypothetical protein